jgi:hypothetical protein
MYYQILKTPGYNKHVLNIKCSLRKKYNFLGFVYFDISTLIYNPLSTNLIKHNHAFLSWVSYISLFSIKKFIYTTIINTKKEISSNVLLHNKTPDDNTDKCLTSTCLYVCKKMQKQIHYKTNILYLEWTLINCLKTIGASKILKLFN